MSSDSPDTPPNEWEKPYRGYRLQVNSNRDVWWQVYNGTERLYLDPIPGEIVERVIGLKNLGGRFHITEEGDVLTRVENDDGGYRDVWVGEYDLKGRFIAAEDTSAEIPVRPKGLDPGDLWPSVYEGARFSFRSRDHVWWLNPETHRRRYLEEPLPNEIALQLNRYKSQGGSFRVTPWGDIITLIPFHPKPKTVEEQFGDLPSVVRNIIKLRKERGVERLPIYIGTMNDYTFEIGERRALSDPLSEEEQAELEDWAHNLGQTSPTAAEQHHPDSSGDHPDEETEFDDDPEVWGETENTGAE